MFQPLQTYLDDHLGGAQIALEVLASMKEQNDDPGFRKFAASLLPEIEADEVQLRVIARLLGSTPSATKRAGGWLLEKAARLKLGHTGSRSFELFESLELLALGVHGKQCLWKTLQVVAKRDARLGGQNLEKLVRRAEEQRERIENARLELASAVFDPDPREAHLS